VSATSIDMSPIETSPKLESSLECSFRVCERSSAKRIIMASLCSKAAGVGALSALWVLNSRSNRCGFSSRGPGDCIAEVASARCAIEGGLKEESRM